MLAWWWMKVLVAEISRFVRKCNDLEYVVTSWEDNNSYKAKAENTGVRRLAKRRDRTCKDFKPTLDGEVP
jgi:hypothetical protein